MANSRDYVLVLSLLVAVAAAATDSSEPPIVVGPGVALGAEQTTKLREAIPDAGWIEVERLWLQVPTECGSARLRAQGVTHPEMVAERLCFGQLVLFMLDCDEIWQRLPPETYVFLADRENNQCARAHDPQSRIWLREASTAEALGVLEALAKPSPESAGLLEHERILTIEKETTTIKVTTATGRGSGRVLTFERRGAVWIGRVTGGWIA
jgi:hypothetical protein